MKNNLDRVRYYTRKIAQYAELRMSWPHRYNRLMAYKTALNKRLEDELNARNNAKNRGIEGNATDHHGNTATS